MPRSSIFEKEVHPYLQGGVILGGIFIFTCLGLATDAVGLTREDPIFPWMVSVSMLLFFAIGNSVLSLSYKDHKKYWMYSIVAFLSVIFFGGIMAYLFSGISIHDAKSIKWIYVVFSVGYMLFFTIVRSMKRIVTMAQDQDARLRGEE